MKRPSELQRDANERAAVMQSAIEQLRADGWFPVSIDFANFAAGSEPSVRVEYERVVNGVTERRTVVFK